MIAGLLIAVLVVVSMAVRVRLTLRRNTALLRAVEHFDERDPAIREALLLDLHRLFDRPAADWAPALSRDGITVSTRFSSQALTGGRGVRTYRAVSYLKQDEISVERIIALLDGGFLNKEVWYKRDFKGGARIETLDPAPGQSAWIPLYLSDIRPLRLREFLYLLYRRELLPHERSQHLLWQDEPPVRQVCIAYRSVNRPPQGPGRVRAIQYPSLDRISLYRDGTICWEHIMAFHVAGVLPLWMNNLLVGPASATLWQEAANMRKYTLPAPA